MTDIAKIRTGKVKGTMNSNNLSDYYYNHSFMERLRKRLPEILPNTYCIVAIDIEHFRLFNKLYGRSSGDEVIRYIYTCLKQSALEYDGIDAYLGGDNFVAFLPDDDEVLNRIRQKIVKKLSKWNNTSAFFPLFGVYTIKNTTVLPELMYDHAMLALSYAEEDYKWHICRYTIEMESSLEEEVYLLAAIEEGLEKEEFTFFAQPQCNIATGQIVGAEALVRWQKPDGEVLLPGGFIPVLEKNKMIDQLDRYVWEKVCQWLKGWIDQGYSPVPISINVSRIDIFEMDVPKYIFSLLEKYQIPEYLIKIEITESAYTENNNRISHAVNTLRNRGLVVMMDDFGCGYSSLNMLKNIPVDVLKLDMRFLQFKEEEKQKSANILEAIVKGHGSWYRNWLFVGMPFILMGWYARQNMLNITRIPIFCGAVLSVAESILFGRKEIYLGTALTVLLILQRTHFSDFDWLPDRMKDFLVYVGKNLSSRIYYYHVLVLVTLQIQTDIRNGWLPILVLLISFFLAELLYRIEMIRCSKKAA